MKTYFYGDLVQNEDLYKVAKQIGSKHQDITVFQTEKDFYLKNGWQIKRQFKNKIRLQKVKSCDKLLEDESWLLFKNMGFTEMNKDRNFKIKAGPVEKQIDVFAKDNNNVFIVFCTTKKEKGPSQRIRKEIHEILNLRKDLIESIRNYYKGEKIRISFLLITKNIIWNLKDEKLASKNQLFFWKESDLEAYTSLTEQLGNNAKFQMYSILFSGRKFSEIGKTEVPAIYGGKGDKKYYCFIIQPKKLFPIAYIHRREKGNPKTVSDSYQRMIKKSRIDDINNFINQGGFFPNNIIINFTKKPIFERKAKVGNITYGILKFPPYYGAAWVIDGQHRLYGYSNNEKAETHTLPVIAFESLAPKDQANLFVDINKEQKAVSASLLWDLYPDIYYESGEEQQQILRTISLIAKKLNYDNDSIFYDHIQIPSLPIKDRGKTNLTLESVCRAIKKNKLINEEEGLLYEKNYDNTVNSASKAIEAYFSIIAKYFPKDWKKGKKGLFRTNVGISIFFIIFRQLLKYLEYKGQDKIYRKKDLVDFKNETKEILGPVLIKLKEMSETERREISQFSGEGPVMKSTQKLIWDLKEKLNFGLELWNRGGWTPDVEESNKQIREIIDDSEIKLRSFIINELKEIHGRKWFKQGVPANVRNYIKETIGKDIAKTPYLKNETPLLTPEEKLTFISTSHLREIIMNGNNWEKFKNTFAKDKECTSVQFKFFETLRNKYKHPGREAMDEIEKKLGYWGMQWIRRCAGIDNIKK